MSFSAHHVCITAIDEDLGPSIASFFFQTVGLGNGVISVSGLVLRPSSSNDAFVMGLGGKIVQHVPGREESLVDDLKKIACDTICLVPPKRKERLDLTMEVIRAAKKAGISNAILISSAGADHATKEKQPRLHELIELERAVLSTSPCIIRAGLLSENILNYSHLENQDGSFLALPLSHDHRFAPISFGNVASLAGSVVAEHAKIGYRGRFRARILLATGPMLCSGPELAEAASKALRKTLRYKEISEAEAKNMKPFLEGIVGSAEWEQTWEYYSLVREGKTNFCTTTFHDVTRLPWIKPEDSFNYVAEAHREPEQDKN